MTSTRTVASFYSQSAEGYEELWAPELLRLSVALVDELPLTDAKGILDLGSGVGSLLPTIEGRAPEALLVATDVAHGMLRRAPREIPRVTSDAQDLPFADATFDLAILAFMLFHVPEPFKALNEVHRVLRPGATIGTITWGEDPDYLAFDIWNEELGASGAVSVPPLARHELVDTEAKVAGLLRSSGFTDIRTWVQFHELQMDLESFLAHRTGHGTSRNRFESLSEQSRSELITRVRDRLRDRGPEAFLDRTEVIYATARSCE